MTDASAAPRLLVVEDEYLIRMLLEDMLDELGYGVAAAVGSLAEAREHAAKGSFDGAILDVNVDGQEIFPVAEILSERGVPFVFVTGYDAESVDARFRNVPVLQKPIERDVLQRIFVVAAKAAVAG